MTRISDGGKNIGRLVGAYGDQNKVKKPDKGDKTQSGKADAVVLSQRAQEVLRLREQMGQTPEIRADKVQGIKLKVESGTYAPDPRAVADKLIDKKVVD